MSAPRVLLLSGGPDAEHEVSLMGHRGVLEALSALREVHAHVIPRDRPFGLADLRALPGEVVFPLLHGPWGEGGPLQDLLESDGRPYVGCGPRAARLAMDKAATKAAALELGIPTAPMAIFSAVDAHASEPSLGLPVVVKPVHEGSSVGVHVCKTREDWQRACQAVIADLREHPHRVYMIERAVLGAQELTCGWLDGAALPLIRIVPKEGLYDFQAKYYRDDTRYEVEPELPPGVTRRVQERAEEIARALGVRHLCRVDFLLDPEGEAWLLEVNTMPGFTSHSLLPMAAGRKGLSYADLASALVGFAWRDGGAKR
ncbi:MAG: D-alanine--D-alanine ligase [Planctomycetota bacterium]|nr:D-alanine--D-alanine ligase [Planctomycetota bacterium]